MAESSAAAIENPKRSVPVCLAMGIQHGGDQPVVAKPGKQSGTRKKNRWRKFDAVTEAADDLGAPPVCLDVDVASVHALASIDEVMHAASKQAIILKKHDVKQLAQEEDAMPRPVLFWRVFEEHGYLSNWGRSPFELQGHHFNCAEQYLMWSKADVMGDVTSAQQILSTPDPKRQKALGRQVHPWDEGLWKQCREAVMLAATRAKFAQNSHLRQRLLETHPRRLAEASPLDKVWGIGLAPDNPLAQDPQNWKGENLLGQVLEQVRGELLEEKQSQL